MKRTELTIALISVLLFSLALGAPMIEKAKANPFGTFLMFWRDKITVESPQNETYNAGTLPLNFTVEYVLGNPPATYILNHQKQVQLKPTNVSTRIINGSATVTVYIGQYTSLLTNLTDGTHTLEVIKSDSVRVSSISVNFTVDTTPPTISDLTLENTTYNTSEIPLNFTVDEPVSQITYSLDKKENVTITGNTTLTDLPTGAHTLKVYAIDAAGNTGESESITFHTQKPFSTTLVVAPLASVVVLGLGLLVYLAKTKKPSKTEKITSLLHRIYSTDVPAWRPSW